MKGYKVMLTNNLSVEAIPDENGVCKFSVDDTEITINNGAVVASSSFAKSLYVIDVKETEIEKGASAESPIEEGAGIMRRTCITCGSLYYCATNGCMNTPCGWVCG